MGSNSGKGGDDAAAVTAPPPAAAAGEQEQQQEAEAAAELVPAAPADAAASAEQPAAPAAPAGDGKTDYGAATASLSDPACVRGTPQFAAAKEANDVLLRQYNAIKKRHEDNRAAKADMKAASEVTKQYPLPERYGHIPGVAVGDEFLGRGELAVLGLHSMMMKGIAFKKNMEHGAVAIAVSGGYRDNDDRGQTFTYAGAGGQDKNKTQVADQSYAHTDNAALVQNFETGTPVRLFRARPGYPPIYVYEGLYAVVGHTMERSSDGPQVIRFTMRGVPGHSAVNAKVEYRSLTKAKAFQQVALAGRGAGDAKEATKQRRKVPKNYAWSFDIPSKRKVLETLRERKGGAWGRLVSTDISQGQENMPIAAWNSLDESDTPFVPTNLDHLPIDEDEDLDYDYISDIEFQAADEALQLAERAHALFAAECPITCGIQYHGGACPYNEEGLLMQNHVHGLMECPANCPGSTNNTKGNNAAAKGAKGKAAKRDRDKDLCQRNRVVQKGIQYPLEVFKVAGKGWGVRCSTDVPGGAVLCSYMGTIMTDESADFQCGADTYLYDLNHFHLLDDHEEQDPDPTRNKLLPRVPRELKEHHLVVDASHEGNVARFFNHSCDPNCIIQTVFCKMARSHLLHYIVIVAAEDIPKFTELTYDYGALYVTTSDEDQQAAGGSGGSSAAAAAAAGGDGGSSAGTAATAAPARRDRTVCNCGAYNCRGWLKN